MFDRIACFMVRVRARRHFVMSIIKNMNIISVHFWTYLSVVNILRIVRDKCSKIISDVIFSHDFIVALQCTE